ncbi:peptidoglycan/LPS O-acetylase OafA/YrhL [Cellulosimicrobium cellulans]|uniref:acyltransferase family protein n=1 Tax=Cellulosimicrobium cellulans TaxID=1710 RepID=UPI00142FF1EE|nr:acyltransferase family protein [Cellulosimicrobium cellulans]MBM7820887.1 peptidoglycan/LPS O-acetylase OafA/YrhL [Cellulosimicrobium cellulans]
MAALQEPGAPTAPSDATPGAGATAAGAVRRHARPRTATSREGYRYDLDGLRAVAILLVVVYHVWLGRVSGGVDVFLMLSAFFLTGSFARRLSAGRGVAVGAYWARTFKRLVPVSAVVLLGVLGTAYLLYPPSSWPSIWTQTWTSLGYVQNWELAREAVDYYARDGAAASPLQHYWSLSVQGQVFVLWPLLLLLSGLVVRRLRVSVTPVLLTVFGTVFVASLAFSVVETASNQGLAYFDTRTRLWEFALGSLVAVVLPFVRMPARAAVVVGWVGLALIVTCGLVLDVQGGFPGYFALWPTMAAAAVIVAGTSAHPWAVGNALAHPVLRSLGRDAYALYLVHWPLLITWRVVTGRQVPSWHEGAAIVVVSLVLARVLTTLVERPVRDLAWARTVPWRGAVAVLVAVSVVAVPLVTWQSAERARAAEALAGASADNPGARVLLPGYQDLSDPTAPPVPAATALDAQWVSLAERCSGPFAPDVAELAKRCGQLVPPEPQGPTVVVVGDSHSEQFMGALIPVAERESWTLVSVLYGGCSFGTAGHPCRAWNEQVLDYVLELGPDAVFTVTTAAEVDGPGESVVAGLQEAADTLADAGIALLGVRDNPRFSTDMFVCAEQHGPDADACRLDLASRSAARNPADDLRVGDGSVLVDLSAAVCPDGWCVPVVGNVHVFLDDNHLTWDYARSLAPFLEDELSPWTDRATTTTRQGEP